MLRPFWKDATDLELSDLIAGYGSWVSRVSIVSEASVAKFAVLPMSWNYYITQGLQHIAKAFIRKADDLGMPVLTWSSGDLGVAPLDQNVYVFRSSGYASDRLPLQLALPVFFQDPLWKQLKVKEIEYRPFDEIPVVGFCGQAYAPFYKNAFDVVRTVMRNGAFRAGLSPFEPQQIYPSSLIRKRALSILSEDSRIDTRFVIRKAYRAGAKTAEERASTSHEYYANILHSDYTVCIRGKGNFSARLYETMALGRIPIIVNTDCIYPWDELIDWKKVGVWVEQRDIDSLPDLVIKFHKSMNDSSFRSCQARMRTLYTDRLSLSGFFSTLIEKLEGNSSLAPKLQ